MDFQRILALQVLLLYSFGFAVPSSGSRAQAPGEVPVFKVTPVKSTIKFAVKASVPIEGTFEKWDASLTFTSTHAEDAVLDIKIQAASVNTGSGMKDGKAKEQGFLQR